jgi:hypothetical protein
VRRRQDASGGIESGDFCRPRLADVNEAGEQELRELRFKVGDALPADDPLARFILGWIDEPDGVAKPCLPGVRAIAQNFAAVSRWLCYRPSI